jgi:D-alanyl-lipoteichoic acid acyltransferase DltB (MBOAT superfamily)
MSFNSFQFLLFFGTVLIIYFIIPHRFKWLWLLFASYFFYLKIKLIYIFIILFVTIITYYAGVWIGKCESKRIRKLILSTDLLICIGLLFIFKYYNFFINFIGDLLENYNISFKIKPLNLSIPIGISFYIFKSLSYIIDVYRNNKVKENHFGKLALYIAFFPQLLAGPIERANNFLPQVSKRFNFDEENIKNGVRQMLWGLFQKIVIADNLALLVDAVYNNPIKYNGLTLICATIFFSFQIYCDFSGYSDIAIGSAKLLGFTTITNFDRPYFATSIQDFWRRWHISLSTWLRDYIYFPLGGSRVSIIRYCFNIVIVMLICGIWHGANLTFIIWGLLHGFYLIVFRLTQNKINRLYKIISIEEKIKLRKGLEILITFSLVSMGWIFFRANNLSEAFYILLKIFKVMELNLSINELIRIYFLGELRFETFVSIFSIGFLLLVERKTSFIEWVSNKSDLARWLCYYLIITAILLFGNFGQKQFIYFQF